MQRGVEMSDRGSPGRRTGGRGSGSLRSAGLAGAWRLVRYGGAALLGAALMWVGLRLGAPRPAAAPSRPDPVSAAPEEFSWTALPEAAFPLPPYARFLRGVRIVLDPGHVGQRDPTGQRNRGPTGLREAEVNLRVAQFLRGFLVAAGAEVVLTREVDECLDLPDPEDQRQRAAVANDWPADLLLSIHHNAATSPEANYTALFYHAADDYAGPSRCAARHLLTGLDDVLRLPTHLECAVQSDRVLYASGLGVLRAARVPAVVSEASFHTHPAEEARLRDPLYNRREAYGLLLGLARWAQAGLPRIRLVRPEDGVVRAGGEVVVALDDGLSGRGGWGAEQARIVPESLVVRLDGAPVRHRLDLGARQVRVTLPKSLRGRSCVLRVDFANTFDQRVLHPRLELVPAR